MEYRPPLPPNDTPLDRLDNRLQEFLQVHRNTLRRYFQSCGMFSGHPRILFHLRHAPGLTQKELATQLGVAPATLSVSVRRLEAAGLVERRADEGDARLWRMYLTPQGEELDTRCAQGRDFLIQAQFADFSQEDIAVLENLLVRMRDNLDKAAQRLDAREQETDM